MSTPVDDPVSLTAQPNALRIMVVLESSTQILVLSLPPPMEEPLGVKLSKGFLTICIALLKEDVIVHLPHQECARSLDS